MSSSARRRRAQDNMRAAEALLRTHFEHQHMLKFETALGNGTYGATFRVHERRKNRKLVIKRSIHPRGEETLRSEIDLMRVS